MTSTATRAKPPCTSLWDFPRRSGRWYCVGCFTALADSMEIQNHLLKLRCKEGDIVFDCDEHDVEVA